ncbi:MAG: nitroreductase family protein [Bacillota bacterium]|nr:nitroreductase family protein [Bacillota bacterium]
MDIMEAVKSRHSVRQYEDRPLEPKVIKELQNEIEACCRESGLHIQLVTNEPKAFGGIMGRSGKFSGVTDYIAMVGKNDENLEEKCGYYGERLVLKAQQLGLNTCWAALSYSKGKAAVSVEEGEKLCLVIAVGYGSSQGVPHKSKSVTEVTRAEGQVPEWFIKGAEAALLAPTAVNQQKFSFELNGSRVTARPGRGFYTKVDLGIVRYHFEIGAGKENFTWE